MLARRVVIAVGHRLRGDDAVGPLVLDRLATSAGSTGGDPPSTRVAPDGVELVELDGEAARVIEVWDSAALVVVVDACVTGAPAGTVRRVTVTGDEVPHRGPATSSHSTGIAEAVALGRALGRLPERLVVVAVEGDQFELGARPQPAVRDAVGRAAVAVLDELTPPQSSMAP